MYAAGRALASAFSEFTHTKMNEWMDEREGVLDGRKRYKMEERWMLIGNLWLSRTYRPLPVHPKLNSAVWWVYASPFPTTCSLLSLFIVHTFRIDWIVVYVVLRQTHAKLYIVNRKIAIIDEQFPKQNQNEKSINGKCRRTTTFNWKSAEQMNGFAHRSPWMGRMTFIYFAIWDIQCFHYTFLCSNGKLFFRWNDFCARSVGASTASVRLLLSQCTTLICHEIECGNHWRVGGWEFGR